MATGPWSLDLMTFGEPMILFLAGDELPLSDAARFDVSVAGAESNLAIGLARLGHQPAYFTRVGDDAFGARIQRILRGEGIAVDNWVIDQTRPTGVLIRDSPAGRPISVDYRRSGSAAAALTVQELPIDLLRAAPVCHVTGITAALSESNFAATRQAMITAAEAGATVSFDPNVRLRLADPPRWQAIIDELARHADIVFAGREEAEMISPEIPPQNWFAGRGATTIVVKDGAAGATEYRAVGGTGPQQEFLTVHEEVRRVPLVDPVGAGDAFNAGWLSAWLDGVAGPGTDEATVRLARGAAMASAVVSARGDAVGIPDRVALDQILDGAVDIVR